MSRYQTGCHQKLTDEKMVTHRKIYDSLRELEYGEVHQLLFVQGADSLDNVWGATQSVHFRVWEVVWESTFLRTWKALWEALGVPRR